MRIKVLNTRVRVPLLHLIGEIMRLEEMDAAFALQYCYMIGEQVRKESGKPFSSGSKTNTVKGIVSNPMTARLGFTFKEDDSVVDCSQCIPIFPYCIPGYPC